MLIIDTHCHSSPYWFEPVEVLVAEMDRAGVEKATLVQFRGVFDNTYEIECVKRYPGRFSAIALVDTAQADAPAQLERWVNEGAEGVRLSPMERSPGADPLAIWRKAQELGIVVSASGGVSEFANPGFESLIQELPGLKIVIEHLGRGADDPEPRRPSFHKVLDLAKYPNTYMKVPGLGELCPRPMPFVQPMPFPDVPPLIEMAIDAFGANRLMWGSDWPPSAAREGYGNALKFPMEYVTYPSEDDKEWVFGKTAASLWKFP